MNILAQRINGFMLLCDDMTTIVNLEKHMSGFLHDLRQGSSKRSGSLQFLTKLSMIDSGRIRGRLLHLVDGVVELCMLGS